MNLQDTPSTVKAVAERARRAFSPKKDIPRPKTQEIPTAHREAGSFRLDKGSSVARRVASPLSIAHAG